MLITVLAFALAMGLLVAFHEWGHYRMAVACGVKVLRFSVGFGRVVWRYKPRRPRPGQEDCEYVLCAIPLGGYVRMLNGKEGEVPAHERDRAFDAQPLHRRALIVAAGPVANLLLAIVLYTALNWWGTQEAKPILAPPASQSMAAESGLQAGDEVLAVAVGDADWEPIQSFDELRWQITQSVVAGEALRLKVRREEDSVSLNLPLQRLKGQDPDASLFERVGVIAPRSEPRLGDIGADGAASRAGLQKGDRVLWADGQPIEDAAQLRRLIRESLSGQAQPWEVERSGKRLQIIVTPAVVSEGSQRIGRIGAFVGEPPAMVLVRHGLWDGLVRGLTKTWEMSALTVRMMWRMLTGAASLKNISGPLTIADYAGKSASIGAGAFLGFLAVLSVSLGVLNLLPIPVLDGGHLMYYLWEAVRGKPLDDVWLERLQRGGMAMLLLMMSLAMFNDVSRYLLPWLSQ